MTQRQINPHRKGQKADTGSLFLLIGTLLCFLLLLRSPALAVRSVGEGISLCVGSVIPALFPFMVLSELCVSGGLIGYLPRRLLTPMRRLLGLSETGCAAVLLGLLCGSPVGARCAALGLSQGVLTRREAERIMTCSACPSSAFVIGAVGVTLLGDRALGVRIYIAALFAALLCGILFRLLCGDAATPSDYAPTSPEPKLSAGLFTEAIAASAKSILLVSAYVVFFSALMGTLGAISESFSRGEEALALLFCLLELSGGVARAAALTSPTLCLLLAAFAVGWSGFSVHCQIKALCQGTGISLRPYLFAKLVQGLLCPLLVWLSFAL